jgi:HSP20 family protein
MNDKSKTEVATEKKAKGLQTAAPESFFSPFNDMDRWFEDAFPARMRRRAYGKWPSMSEFRPFEGRMPTVDVIDRDKEIYVRAEIPGVDKKDLDISVTEDSVSIKGSVKHEEKEEKGEYYRHETSSGSFSRTMALPCDVDSSKAKATFKDGVLEMTLPKVKESSRKKISVE